MTNEFINYLNTMNNANSGNNNALAESQILNDYYEKIRVNRKIGDEIYKYLFNDVPRSLILTGHAGDGKTSLLIQILNEIGFSREGKRGLKEFEVYNGDKSLFYVKDMSELNKEQQEKNLKEFLNAPNKNLPSILISNTGPLINTFKRIINPENNKEDTNIEEFEGEFLECIQKDLVVDKEFNIANEKFYLTIFNIAQIDNIYFVKEIIDKILNEELWNPCNNCNQEQRERCPIYFNKQCLKTQKDRVVDIIQKMYFWLKESETRLTIRQIISHLSYAITGNLTCEYIENSTKNKNNILFDYHFGNLFFGQKGTKQLDESFNIKAIRELERLNLDQKAFVKQDNVMFVKEDFSDFSSSIKEMLENKLNENLYSLDLNNKESQEMRRAFRRFYILFGNNEDDYENLLKEIFSEVYPLYYKLINGKIGRSEERYIKNIVFLGLYKLFTGVSCNNEDNIINLTLKKNFDDTQNVQMVIGSFKKDEIELKQNKNKTIEKEIKEYIPMINIGNVKYELTHESLNYLYKLKEGVVFTSYNPNFTFGISRLKSELIREFRDSKRGVKLLVIKRNKIEKIKFDFDDDEIYVEKGGW